MRTYHGTHWQNCSLVSGITLMLWGQRPFWLGHLFHRQCIGSRNSLIMYSFLLLHLWCFQGGNGGEVNCPDWFLLPPLRRRRRGQVGSSFDLSAVPPGTGIVTWWALSDFTFTLSRLWGSLCTNHGAKSSGFRNPEPGGVLVPPSLTK